MQKNPLLRYTSLALVFGFMGIALVIKLIHVQVFPQKHDIAEQEYLYSGRLRQIVPTRGQIYDRWGHLLAGNEVVYEVGIDFPSMVNPETVALVASSMLDWKYDEIISILDYEEGQAPYQYLMLADFVPTHTVEEIKQYRTRIQENPAKGVSASGKAHSLTGLIFRPHLARTYPEKGLASNILGFVTREDRGYFGVEQYFNELLAGVTKSIWVSNDPNMAGDAPETPEGASLVLTIDREIQSTVEEILDKAIKESGSESGTILVMNPNTGEILGMASNPRMDLNEYWRVSDFFQENQAFNLGVQSYEPGSVFKIVTMAAALDSGTVEPDTVFVDTGSINVGGITIRNWNWGVGGITIRNWNWGAWGPQDMTGCLQHSLNVCLAWLAVEMKAGTFYDYLNAFGFGEFTGVELSGEVTGRVKMPGDGDWYEADLGTNAFGQGITTTPVQMLMAISAVANNQGKMMVPHVVHSVVNQGRQFEIEPQVAGMPISAKTAKTLSNMLAVSLEQEASDALVEGYRVAGKTGTAEIATDSGYTSSLTNASFVGWGPVDDPQFLVYVWLQKPTVSPWGSVVAAPVFKEVVTRLVVLMDIPPDGIRQAMAMP